MHDGQHLTDDSHGESIQHITHVAGKLRLACLPDTHGPRDHVIREIQGQFDTEQPADAQQVDDEKLENSSMQHS
jgi:hypothetical protein